MIDPHHILAKYPSPVPRYTSYPTAPNFVPGLGKTAFSSMAKSLQRDEKVSVYVHIPYCDRLCWFCGCHTKHTLKYGPIAHYVAHLVRGIALVGDALSFKPKLGALHFGGGSPSLLNSDDASQIMAALHDVFGFDKNCEISVEIDPSDAKEAMFASLESIGVTRASIGVQDFHTDVQTAINRPQSFEKTEEVVTRLRADGVASVNMDALYGLPRQSGDRLMRTLEKCVSLSPERMALFGYAHVPWMAKHQKMINESDLPNQLERYEHAKMASEFLVGAGYQAIGIDHFARPDDGLAIAARNHTLRRNFQGYTTDNHKVLFGFGASSISSFEGGFMQNIVPTKNYENAIEAGSLPLDKGYLFSADDRLRKFIIEQLMCQFKIEAEMLANQFGADAASCIEELKSLAINEIDGLCVWEDEALIVSEDARPFVRIVASWIDAHIRNSNHRFSKAV